MSINRDALAAMILLAGFLGYGYQATTITLFPGQETEVFSPRTMPYALAIAGVLLSALQLFRCLGKSVTEHEVLTGFDWARASLLCLNMVVYGLLFVPLGFIMATALFLAGGFAILGERRLWLLTATPLLFTVIFWALMTQVLGLYLAPGLLGL